MCRISPDDAGGQNVCAFLDMIAKSEATSTVPTSDDGYNVIVGSTATKPILFTDYSTHPNRLNTKFHSTAAGRYQLLHRFYVFYKSLLRLDDFGPIAQDKIAIQQIKECRAFADIQQGRIEIAITKCAHIWASFPGAGYPGQTERPMSYEIAAYQAAGGTIV